MGIFDRFKRQKSSGHQINLVEPHITLDESVPLIGAIRRINRSGAPLDDASSALAAAERETGVFIVNAGSLGWLEHLDDRSLRPGAEPLTLNQILSMVVPAGPDTDLREIEARYQPADMNLLDALDQTRIFPFLSRTMLVIGGSAFTSYHVVFIGTPGSEDPPIEAFGCWWSFRGWGLTLADWATREGWTHADGSALGYVDFYLYPEYVIRDYVPFVETALKVIEYHTTTRMKSIALK